MALELGRFLEGIGTVRYIRAVAGLGPDMVARSIASGTISFGLVAIPVKLYSTVDTAKAVHFNYLASDGSRLKQQYVRASDGKVVEPNEKVQGYEFQKGRYVTFTPDELRAMNVEATNAIDIAEFVPLEDVERIFIEKVYYLGPDNGAARAYHLLRAALAETKRAALAKYAARGKSYLVLIRPMGEGLVMEQLKHLDELRPFT
ncbi:MAG TPA: Ku protein, partial [Candidatus Cybelea sp.]|nr:Ku protein [Candidatus Cybelea sp.]